MRTAYASALLLVCSLVSLSARSEDPVSKPDTVSAQPAEADPSTSQPAQAGAVSRAAASSSETSSGPVAGGETPSSASTMVAPGSAGSAAAHQDNTAETAGELQSAKNPEETRLRKRVQARWDALLRNDYDSLYGFTSPSYRKAFSKKHFLSQYATQIKRTGIEITGVEFTNAYKSTAKVKLNILYLVDLWGGKVHKGSRHHTESWVKEGDEWWRVEKR